MRGERRMTVAALLLSVFVAGALGGAVVTKVFEPDPWHSWERRRPEYPHPGGMTPRDEARRPDGWPRGFSPMSLSERVAGMLELTDDQRQQVKEILEVRHGEAAKILKGIEPRLRAQLDTITVEIRSLLTPEQQERFDLMLEREEEMFTRRMARPDTGGPPRH